MYCEDGSWEEQTRKLGELDIDVQVGLKYCGDMEFYKEVLAIAYQSYLEKCPQLEEYFVNEDYKNYTILVHSMKSGSANIGAMRVSEMAKALEDAGKADSYDYIKDNHVAFIERYSETMLGLGELLGINEGDDLSMDNEVCDEQFHKELELPLISHYLDELELDMAKAIVDKASRIDEENKELFVKISSQLERFDVEGAKANLSILMG